MKIFFVILCFISVTCYGQIPDTTNIRKDSGEVNIRQALSFILKQVNSNTTTIAGKQNELGFTPVLNTRTVNAKALSSDISIDKTDVGLPNVDNTSDANKPVSAATQTALNTKMNIWYAADGSANDSYSITLSPAPAAYFTGMMVVFKANTANTTGCTININGLGVKAIVKRVSTTPATGDILAGMLCWIVYDGTQFILLNPVVN